MMMRYTINVQNVKKKTHLSLGYNCQEEIKNKEDKMAKYSKFDPRNKKQGRHKAQSQNKDLKEENRILGRRDRGSRCIEQ